MFGQRAGAEVRRLTSSRPRGPCLDLQPALLNVHTVQDIDIKAIKKAFRTNRSFGAMQRPDAERGYHLEEHNAA